MVMCIHRAIKALEEGANFELPKDIKDCLISESINFEIYIVLQGNPHCYTGLFYEKATKPSSKIIQKGKIYNYPFSFDESLPAVLIYKGIIMLYLP